MPDEWLLLVIRPVWRIIERIIDVIGEAFLKRREKRGFQKGLKAERERLLNEIEPAVLEQDWERIHQIISETRKKMNGQSSD